MAEKTDATKTGDESVKGKTADDFLPRNICPICYTRGSSPDDNAKHLKWHKGGQDE